ncbi:hypothetical protein BpHYR1_015031 [Brachionus plicatilis]|uniref:Uncharacterized protein n=1 Tax=Brachionus plicatilis TaxID=10195 RepID=A0A3M7QJP0_BRAPC|nr:hypothetical protein BpHYR1_015031 [Brachionus plicatilis]
MEFACQLISMSEIDINPYWNQFQPVSKKWYYTFAFVCFLIDFLGILTNLLVLYYLIKKRSKRIILINVGFSAKQIYELKDFEACFEKSIKISKSDQTRIFIEFKESFYP